MKSLKGRFRRTFKTLYPYANTGFEIWLLLWNISYLFDRTPAYRPWLNWIGVDLRRLGVEDFVRTSRVSSLRYPDVVIMQRAASLAAQSKLSPDQRQSLVARLRSLLLSSPRLLLDSLRLLLPTAVFFVKFLEWWYSPGSPARSLATSPQGPAIPPPSMLPPHPQGISFDKQAYGVCPICKKSINNATALPSGYVYCYRCAYEQVERHGKCPITLLPTRVWQLRKVLV